MAIRLIEEYPNRVGAPTADYPHGVPRNKSTPTATDGTPFEQSWFRDQEGFFQGLMETAGITPNGQPDTVLNSDYLDALNRVTNGVIEVDMAGADDVSLSAYQGRVAALKLTGALAADVDLIVPDTERMYWIIDETTDDFSVTVKTAAGTGVKLFGESSAVRSDGTNVVPFVNGLDRRVIYVDSIADLQALPVGELVDGQQVQVKEYHAGTGVGGGDFYWDASKSKTEHNGGTIIDPDKAFPADFASEVGTESWFTADGVGTGCFVRTGGSEVATLVNFGGDPSGNSYSDAAIDGLVNGILRDTSVSLGNYRHLLRLGSGVFRFGRGHVFDDSSSVFLSIQGEGDARKTVLLYEGTDTVFLEFKSQYMSFSNFFVRSSTEGKTFIKNYNENGTADCDVYFYSVRAVSWRYVHHCVGRGSVNHNCTVAGGGVTTWAFIESPDPFTETSNQTIQTLETGMRRYASFNLEVDNAYAIFEFSETGPAAEYINEVTIDGVQGNQLFRIIDGGYINYASIKTGSLVASLQGGIVVAARLRDADVNVTSTANYDRSATPGPGYSAPYAFDIRNGPTTTEVLIENLNVSGIFGGLSNKFIITNGYVRNINICNLTLSKCWEYGVTSSPRMVSANGYTDDNVINFDNIIFDCDSFDAPTFRWLDSFSFFNLGNYVANAVPIKRENENFGSVTVSSGETTAQITHGMARTPVAGSDIITLGSAPSGVSSWWISGRDADYLTLSVDAAPTADVTFNWHISMSKQ